MINKTLETSWSKHEIKKQKWHSSIMRRKKGGASGLHWTHISPRMAYCFCKRIPNYLDLRQRIVHMHAQVPISRMWTANFDFIKVVVHLFLSLLLVTFETFKKFESEFVTIYCKSQINILCTHVIILPIPKEREKIMLL